MLLLVCAVYVVPIAGALLMGAHRSLPTMIAVISRPVAGLPEPHAPAWRARIAVAAHDAQIFVWCRAVLL